jgi:glycine/D-amino acid oxidase-like deaminating enzyme
MDLRTGAPYWPLADGLIAAYPPLERDDTCAVAIIGAGVTGALVAERLTRVNRDVVLVDRHDVGMGSTAASTGLLLYETDTSLHELTSHVGVDRAVRSWRAGLQAIADLEALCDGSACRFARRPSTYLASCRGDVSGLEAEYALMAQHGFAVEWLDRSAVAGTFGFTNEAAIRSHGDAEVDTYALTHHAIARAIERGARVYDRTDVTDIRRDGSGVTLATNRGPIVRAERLVVAAGYEVARYLERSYADLQSTWAFVSEPVADLSWWPERSLIWETSRPYTYLRTTSDNRVVVGGEDEPWESSHQDLDLMRTKTTRLLSRFARLFPDISLEAAYSWAGVFAETPDGLPYIGTLPTDPSTCFALGYGGNGITFSMVAASVICEWCAGSTHPDADVFAFDR